MLVLALCLSVASASPDSRVGFQVHRAQAEPFRFVRFGSGPDGLVLAIYGKSSLLKVVPESAANGFGAHRLGSHESYVFDPGQSGLAVRKIHFPCLDLATAPALADLTLVEFPDGFPWFEPRVPLPKPDPLPPVAGARSVHLSGDGRLAILVEEQPELDLARDVSVFSREADSLAFDLKGSYVNAGWAEIRSALGGRRFAQSEGTVVRVFDAADLSQPMTVQPLFGAFDISSDGAWLACELPDGVALHALPSSDGGAGTGEVSSRKLEIHVRPLGLRFARGWLVVRGAKAVQILDPEGGESRVLRTSMRGTIGSVDVLPLSQEQALVAVTALDIVQPPLRRSGKFVKGRAIASVEVLDTANPGRVAFDSFDISRWDRGMPYVAFFEETRQVVVTTPDSVVVSDRIGNQ